MDFEGQVCQISLILVGGINEIWQTWPKGPSAVSISTKSDKLVLRGYLMSDGERLAFSATSARLGKNQAVSMEVLGKICNALNCDIGDIVESNQ